MSWTIIVPSTYTSFFRSSAALNLDDRCISLEEAAKLSRQSPRLAGPDAPSVFATGGLTASFAQRKGGLNLVEQALSTLLLATIVFF